MRILRLPMPSPTALIFVLGLALGGAANAAESATPPAVVAPGKADATWKVGEEVTWTVRGTTSATSASYVVRRDGRVAIDQCAIALGADPAIVRTRSDHAGTLELDVTVKGPTGKASDVFGGAAIDPAMITPAVPRPDDFKVFWQAQLAALAAIPANPVLVSKPCDQSGVDYWHLTLDSIDHRHVQGQLARPTGTDKRPALLLLQYAGVYALQPHWVTNYAHQGWLVLNVEAHDLPVDEGAAFYADQAAKSLNNYPAIGCHDRTTSYFLPMVLGAVRAAQYLAGRPDWDGQILEVSGTSQGGFLTLATAGLDPQVTAACAMVPAGCDTNGPAHDRAAAWPYWSNFAKGPELTGVFATARYFDACNFAADITCPTLIGVGLIDPTARPTSVIAAFNQVKGPKELVILPGSNHYGTGNTQAPFLKRLAAWTNEQLAGRPAPVQAP